MLLSERKEARGSPLFSYLDGVQKVGSSNLPAPTIASNFRVATFRYLKSAEGLPPEYYIFLSMERYPTSCPNGVDI
jgi:hypothetical protein